MTKNELTQQELLDPQEAARIMRITSETLANWRMRKKGPRYVKVGGAIRYRPNDISEWLDQKTVTV